MISYIDLIVNRKPGNASTGARLNPMILKVLSMIYPPVIWSEVVKIIWNQPSLIRSNHPPSTIIVELSSQLKR